MTMAATHRESGLGMCRVFGLAFTVALVIICLAAITDAPCSRHALERHGVEAVIAAQWVSAFGGPGHDCPDGRTRWGIPMWGGQYAVMVKEAGAFVTAFMTDDESYVLRMLDPCKPNGAGAH